MSTPSIIHQPLSKAERRRVWIGTILVLCILLGLALFAIPYVKKALTLHLYTVSSSSMEPAVYSGDRIAVDESYYKHRSVKDGDVVAFRHGDDLVLIKRVSAIAGETIEGKDGQLIRNGIVLKENYLHPQVADDPSPEEEMTFAARTIPQGEIFVTGDWRTRSLDSRAAEFGPVLLSDVLGKVAFIYGSSHPGQFGRKF